MLQGDDFNRTVTDLVNAANNRQQTFYIAGTVRDNQHIGCRVGRQVPLLRHQWSEDGNQLSSGNVIYLHHACHHLVAPAG